MNSRQIPHLDRTQTYHSTHFQNNLSYADVTRNNVNNSTNGNGCDNHESSNNENNNNILISKIDEMIKTQNAFMTTMMQMIQQVINTLCKQ